MGPDSTEMTRWLATIRTEGNRLGAMPADALDAPVPTLDGWTMERVVRHVGKVHRWVTGLLAAPPDADPTVVARAAPSLAKGPECLVDYRQALDEMLEALATADPDRQIASFVGRTGVRFWCRRQAHEVTIHRVDAADAFQGVGGPAPVPIDEVGALDGIDEWLHVFVATRQLDMTSKIDQALAGKSFGFEPSEPTPTATSLGRRPTWHLTYDAQGVPSVGGGTDLGGDAMPRFDAVVQGPPESLLLAAWRRRPLETITVIGDHDVVGGLLDVSRF